MLFDFFWGVVFFKRAERKKTHSFSFSYQKNNNDQGLVRGPGGQGLVPVLPSLQLPAGGQRVRESFVV